MMGDAVVAGHSEDSDYEVGKYFDLGPRILTADQARTYQDCTRCSKVDDQCARHCRATGLLCPVCHLQ